MRAKNKIMVFLLCFMLTATPVESATPAGILPIALIKGAIKKVIKAMDLRIQKLQNKTIWLQNAQKKLENTLSKIKLKEISDWTEKQKDLYQNYYEELTKVKGVIANYQRIKDITQKQVRLVDAYESAWRLFQKDKHFNSGELDYMQKVYSGILNESMKNIDQIFLILNSFTTTMSDSERLKIINSAADMIDANYDDLMLFNRQNVLLSLQRAKTKSDIEAIKKFYGIVLLKP
ncbi:conjugal transfer protein TraI [Flavobacterium turcicum]|uniref:Conjugal transfer protein TraI n=1 Tax=Flavobacterium turcicum TaxID=2764718 RepID=A0ABR7JFC1_9FLAO|nr:conjugal transfer protein TraI [Flavobacterium turcicum]MBC5862869.1 conjugal transfer protein TraI [Flavobacterium turcicum]NHL01601.1 conjugal transfer protein TraI [Flavobacterium turcicum]